MTFLVVYIELPSIQAYLRNFRSIFLEIIWDRRGTVLRNHSEIIPRQHEISAFPYDMKNAGSGALRHEIITTQNPFITHRPD